MNVEADKWYTLTLNLNFEESQEIDTSDPTWLGKLLSGRLTEGVFWVDDVDWRLATNDNDPEDDIHYGIGAGWTYDREGSR